MYCIKQLLLVKLICKVVHLKIVILVFVLRRIFQWQMVFVVLISLIFSILNLGTFSCSFCLQAAEILSKEGISAEVIPLVEDI